MEPLKDFISIKSVDLRNTLGVAPATLTDIYKKVGLNLPAVDETKSTRGAAKDIASSYVRTIFEQRGYQYPKQAQIIAMMMCKGGVGKTTTTVFLAQRLAAYGCNVLVLDADPQGNATSAFNLDELGEHIHAETPVLLDLITEDCAIEDAIIPVAPNLHLIPSTPTNSTLENKIRDRFKNPSLPIKKLLDPILARYDYILIDCAPALNLTNTAIVSASNVVVMPVAPDKFSQMGLDQTIQEISQIEADFGLLINTRIVFTRFDAREYTSLKYLSEIAEKHREKMFTAMIRTASDLKNAITRKEDLFSYKKSNAKDDYDNLTKELMGLDRFFEKKKLKDI